MRYRPGFAGVEDAPSVEITQGHFTFLLFGVFMYNETFINGVFEFTVTHKGENILTIRVPGDNFSRVLAMRAVAQGMADMAK